MFRNADDKWINNYVTTLKENRIPVSVRRSRGKDIDAACGQLVGMVDDRTKRQQRYRDRLAQEISAVQVH